jgi:hypothetical protein
VAQPTQLTPTEQDALVKQIGLAMLRVAPEDWEQLTVDYRAVGRYAESTAQVVYSDGVAEPWTMPADLQGLFTRLRGGMYRDGRGTWFNARYRLDHPSSYNLEYDREEPTWDMPPPPQAYPDDMRLFPRTDDNVPEWLRRRLATAPPPGPPPGTPMPDRPPLGPPTPRFRVARIFDGPGEDGRPSVNRPPVDEMDIVDLLDYLDGAPLVGPARGYDVDRLDPNGQQSVPVAFHTDGTWIWPAAVNYYLREHDIAPEPDLVEHVRRMQYHLPQVDEQTRSAAQLFLGPPPPGPRPPAPAPTRAMPLPAPKPPMTPPRAALPSQGPPGQMVDQLRVRLEDLDVPESAYRIGPPNGRGWTMEQTDEGWRVGWFDRDYVAPAMFEDVADASAFLLGKLLLDTDRWAAGPRNPELPPMPTHAQAPPPPPQSDGHSFEPMSAPIEDFEPMSAPIEEFIPPEPTPQPTPQPALRPPPGTPLHGPPPGTPLTGPPPGTPPRPEPSRTMAMEPPMREPMRDQQSTVLAARPVNGAATAPPGAEWPISPLQGEPPLTLFRGKRVVDLEPGTEIDRYGEDDGNLVYAAGTPFSERSLVPEWIDRPYHVYRVRQPFQVLTGSAIPWFDQPGGGTAFLLPDAVGDLVAQGHLAELEGRDRPRD